MNADVVDLLVALFVSYPESNVVVVSNVVTVSNVVNIDVSNTDWVDFDVAVDLVVAKAVSNAVTVLKIDVVDLFVDVSKFVSLAHLDTKLFIIANRSNLKISFYFLYHPIHQHL